jgi:hypothetical protein
MAMVGLSLKEIPLALISNSKCIAIRAVDRTIKNLFIFLDIFFQHISLRHLVQN